MCPHGWTPAQGCRECVPSLDWRDDYETRVYGRIQARYLPELPSEQPELGELSDLCGIDRNYGTKGV
jgi:hypothetical protein